MRDRSTYIGGRDIAILAGASKYGSPADVYAKIVCGHTVEMNGAMARGLLLEPGILDWVCRRRGLGDEDAVRDFHTVDLDTARPYMAGSVDMLEFDSTSGLAKWIHEVKTTRNRGMAGWGTPGTDEVESAAYIQVQWYMGLTGTKGAFVWLYNLDVDDGPVEYFVNADDVTYAKLQAIAADFWVTHVIPQVPPAPTAKSDPDAIAAIWPKPVKGKAVPADDQAVALCHSYVNAREREKKAADEKSFYAGQLKAIVGDAERARWDGGYVSWQPMTLQDKVDWEAIARAVCEKTSTPASEFSQIIERHTAVGRSTRTLRVNIKDKT